MPKQKPPRNHYKNITKADVKVSCLPENFHPTDKNSESQPLFCVLLDGQVLKMPGRNPFAFPKERAIRELAANTNQALAIIRTPTQLLNPKYLKLLISSPLALNTINKARVGAMNNISLGDIKKMVVFIPPLEEQHRIVIRVEGLFALCDQLEVKLKKRSELSETMTKTVFNN